MVDVTPQAAPGLQHSENISKRLLRELLAALPGFRPALEEYCQSSTVTRFLVPSFGSVSSSLIFSYNNSILSLGIEMKLPAVVTWALMPLCGRDCELAARELYFIMVLFWTVQATSARPTWTCLQPCSLPISSGSNRLLNMILSGQTTWSSIKHKPSPGHMFPHPARKT